MTTSRTIPAMTTYDLDLLLRATIKWHSATLIGEALPDDPPLDPTMIRAYHILVHPRFDPALHEGLDFTDCPDCDDESR